MLLLAVLLFCAAAVIELSQVRDLVEHPSTLLAGLLSCWFGPVILVLVAGSLLPRVFGVPATEGLLVGLALVAAMPVANSSAGWTLVSSRHPGDLPAFCRESVKAFAG